MPNAHLDSITATTEDGEVLVSSIAAGELLEGLKLFADPRTKEVMFLFIDEEGERRAILFVKDSERVIGVYGDSDATFLHPREFCSNPAVRARAIERGGILGFLESLRDDPPA